jgi:ribosome-associated toxin RatA of RatAB toxin-antitoxin module
MAKAEIEETLSVDRDKFFQAVVGYEQYPKFVEGCTKVEVDRSKPPVSRVTYHVSMIKDISYTLDHTEDAASGKVTWKLVKSDFLKKNIGEWTIQSVGPGKTKVKYSIEIEFNIPVPGLILNRLVKSSLPSMIKGFEKKARS